MTVEKKSEIIKEYSNKEITVVWKPGLCIHSTNCFKGLPGVFNPANRPWVKLEAGTSPEIIKQVGKCPSGALSIAGSTATLPDTKDIYKIEVKNNGPYLINGPVIILKDGKEELKDAKTVALCRCGSSSNKPYCDGTHRKNGFSD